MVIKSEEGIKAIKTTFKSILKKDKDGNISEEGYKITHAINDAMLRTNQIVIYTYQFIKLYIIHCYDNNMEIPVLDCKFITNVMDTLTIKSNKGRPRTVLTEYIDFYNNYMPIEKVSKIGLTQILNYTSTSMKTAYMNAITMSFRKVLSKYIYCIEKNKYNFNEVRSKKKLKELKKEIKKNSKETMDSIINCENNSLVNFLPIKPTKENHLYHLKVKPYDYIKSMIYMNRKLEDFGVKTYSFLPLRNSIIPKYIDIDTIILTEIIKIKNKTKTEIRKNIKDNKFYVWDMFFNLNNKFFKNTFKYHIQTDLVGVSGLFTTNKVGSSKEMNYITDIDKTDLENLKYKHNFVYCDPGKKQLLYMMDDDNKFLRYNIQQRRHEMKIDKYMKISKTLELESNIIELLQPLSTVNSKSFYFDKFNDFIVLKNNINAKVCNYYNSIIHRKFNFRKYTLKQKSEDKLINNIKNTFTKDGKEPLFIYGNWSITKQMAGFVPTPNVHIRKIVSRNFKTLLIDEFRTSCLSYRTHTKIVNMKDKLSNEKIHQVLILTENNKNIGCINRDKNAVRNFKTLTDYYILTGSRHDIFQRGVPLH